MRVLVVRAGALGDLILLRPALCALRVAGHEPVLMAPSGPAAALLGPGPSEVRTLLAWDSADAAALLSADAPLSDRLASFLDTCGAAIVYSRAEVLAARLARLVARVVTHDPRPPAGAAHASAWFTSALAQLGVPLLPDIPPPIVPTTEEAAAAATVLRVLPPAFLAIHPGAGSRAKTAPAGRFSAVVEREAPSQPFALVEGPADRDAAARLRTLAPNAVTLAELPLRVLGAALSRCGLFVGNDSGVSHLAAAYGGRCHVLFGPTDPSVWRPVGGRVTTERFDTSTHPL